MNSRTQMAHTSALARTHVGRLRRAMLAVAMVLLLPLMSVQPASAAVSPALKRYPYLTDAVGTYMTVNWATDRSATTGAVRWGRTGATGSCSPATSVPATRASITVNGVAEYQWKATFSVGTAGEFCYRPYLGSASTDLLGADTSPRAKPQVPVGSSQPYSFAVLGDTGEVDANGDNGAQAALMRSIAASGARFAVQTGDFGHPNNDQTNFGDLVQKGANTSAVFGPSFWKTAGTSIPMFTVPGNHGVTNDAMLVNFPQARAVSTSSGTYAMTTYCCLNGTLSQSQQSAWYAFDAGNARYYMLTAAWADSNLGTLPGTNRSLKLYQNDYDNHWAPGKAEYEWLKNDLAAHAGTAVKMAFFHFPLNSDQATEQSDTNLQGAGSLEGLLASNGVDVAYNGHAHIYQRNNKSPLGLVSYTTGGGGANPQSIGSTCRTIDAYGVGWSGTSNAGNKCGSAPTPSSRGQVFHYLLVTVNGTSVTVTPVNSLDQRFDIRTYDFSGSTTPPTDTTPPTRPTGLKATATSGSSVNLDWAASTDDVGVTTYDVMRDETFLKTVTGTSTSTTDASLTAGTTYSYTVKARDAAGNVSDASNIASVTTPTGVGATSTFVARADARVEQGSPTANFGTSSTIGADQDAAAQVESYLTFGVSGVTGTRTSAKLRVWTTTSSTSPTNNGPAVYGVSDTTWSETGITWNGKPAVSSTATDNKGALPADTLVEYDVTSLVPGNGTYSFKFLPDSSDGTSFNSRTGSDTTKRPQLVITTG